jgi:hypothetical protein
MDVTGLYHLELVGTVARPRARVAGREETVDGGANPLICYLAYLTPPAASRLPVVVLADQPAGAVAMQTSPASLPSALGHVLGYVAGVAAPQICPVESASAMCRNGVLCRLVSSRPGGCGMSTR